MWFGCADRLFVERNGIILFLKKSPQNYDFIRIINKLKNMLSSAQKYNKTWNFLHWYWRHMEYFNCQLWAQACHGWCWLQVKSQCLGFGSFLSLSIFSLSKHHTNPVLRENFGIFFSWTAKLGWRLHTRIRWENLDLLSLPPYSQPAECSLWRQPMVVLLCPLKNVLRAILYLQTTT